METSGLNFLIPDKPDIERDALAEAFSRYGGSVHRIGRFWEPPNFDPATVRVYGPDTFCLVLQQKLGFALCSPEDDLLLRTPVKYLQRTLTRHTIGEARHIVYPAFIKPLMPKQFRGMVYRSEASFTGECRGLTRETAVVVAEVVAFTAEVRCFVLNGRVLSAATYEGSADVADAKNLVEEVARAVSVPRTVVIDVGFIADRGWAVVEYNASWGAGLNGCDPERVLPAVLAASGPSG